MLPFLPQELGGTSIVDGNQKQLLRHVELDGPARCVALRAAVHAKPSIASFVYSVAFGTSAALELSATLAALPVVRTLAAVKLVLDDISPSSKLGVAPHSAVVAKLTLHQPTFTSPGALHTLFASYPNLRSLSLLDATVHPGPEGWSNAGATPHDVFALLRLHDLHIRAPNVSGDGAAVVGDSVGQSIALLDNLHFAPNRQSSIGMLHALMQHVGPGLSSLELDVTSCRADAGILLSGVDVLLANNLSSLTIAASLGPVLSADRVHGDTWDDFITPFLEHLPSNKLRKITVQLHVRSTEWHFIGALEWERLDTALTSVAFQGLERFLAVVYMQAPMTEAQQRVRDIVSARARRLNLRDILRVDFHEPTQSI